MISFSYILIDNDDLYEDAQSLPIEYVTLDHLKPIAYASALARDVVELVRPDAKKHLKHAGLGLEAK